VEQTSLLGQDTVLLHVLSPLFHRNVMSSSSGSNICLWLSDPVEQHTTLVCNDEKHTHPTQHQTPEDIKLFLIKWHCVNCLISHIFLRKNYTTFVNDKFERTCDKLRMAARIYASKEGRRLRSSVRNCGLLNECEIWDVLHSWICLLKKNNIEICNSCCRYTAPCATCMTNW
jgi:hypothetical protein